MSSARLPVGQLGVLPNDCPECRGGGYIDGIECEICDGTGDRQGRGQMKPPPFQPEDEGAGLDRTVSLREVVEWLQAEYSVGAALAVEREFAGRVR